MENTLDDANQERLKRVASGYEHAPDLGHQDGTDRVSGTERSRPQGTTGRPVSLGAQPGNRPGYLS